MTHKSLFLSLIFSFLFASAGFLNIAEAFKLPACLESYGKIPAILDKRGQALPE